MQSLNLFSEIEASEIGELTSSREGFRVSRTASQDKEKAQMILDTSGQTCLRQFASLNRRGLWAKTFAESLIGMEGWYSSKCKLTWRLSGTKYKRLYFQLVPSTLHTEEIEFGLLHTPSAKEPGVSVERLVTKTGEPAKIGERAYDKKTGRLAQVGITQQVQMKSLLPTPCQHNENGRSEGWSPSLLQAVNSLLPTPNARDWKGETGHENQFDLNREVRKLLPTPTAISDVKGGCTRSDESRQNDTLAHAAHGLWGTGKTSQLNPRFVAEMMGFPPDWCELPFIREEAKDFLVKNSLGLGTDANQSKHTGMQ